ncbi:MAG: J domain-containing protein [Devosiaceae bacterium]|nr:J domain-containing protein [Devosiaceae bacterium MH13]
MRDPYTVLGVPKSADSAAVKSAYRKLAKKYHPDQNPDDPRAKERFSEVSAAYELLGDSDKRKAFDRGEIDADGNPTMAGFNPFGGGPRGRAQGGPNPGFDDLFAQFGGGRPGGSGPGAAGFSGGINTEDLLKSMFGGAGPGMGAGMGGGMHPGMGAGMGSGRHQAGASSRSARPAKGADVQASVKVSLEEVLSADKVAISLPGSGTVRIALPKGVTDGQTIRLKGKGKASPQPGGTPGDGMVTITFAAHPDIKAEGATLIRDVPITLDEAVLGARIEVPTLDGTVALNVPKNAPSGRMMRLKERGLPTASGKRGDFLVRLLIRLPEEGDGALEALMRRWRSDGRYTVR